MQVWEECEGPTPLLQGGGDEVGISCTRAGKEAVEELPDSLILGGERITTRKKGHSDGKQITSVGK